MVTIAKLTNSMTWLENIPGGILNRLFLDEFNMPKTKTLAVIETMSKRLGCYIMPYSLDTFHPELPPESHLCANIRRATLSAEKLDTFLDFETSLRIEGITLAAYERPVRLVIPPTLQALCCCKNGWCSPCLVIRTT